MAAPQRHQGRHTTDLARLAARNNILLAPGKLFRPQNQASGFLCFNVG